MPPKGTIPRVCEQCGADFLARADSLKAGYGRLCNRRCRDLARCQRVSRMCNRCGSAFDVPPNRARQNFCSNDCRYGPIAPAVHEDGTATIPLLALDGKVQATVIIDAADAEWAGQYRWSYASGYAARMRTAADGEDAPAWIRMHRELLGLVRGDGLEGDHLNRNRLDNRRSNLRKVSKQGNRQNMPGIVTATSKFRGVSWDKRYGKWAASVKTNGKRFHCGYFTSEDAAAAAALAGRRKHLPYSVD